MVSGWSCLQSKREHTQEKAQLEFPVLTAALSLPQQPCTEGKRNCPALVCSLAGAATSHPLLQAPTGHSKWIPLPAQPCDRCFLTQVRTLPEI